MRTLVNSRYFLLEQREPHRFWLTRTGACFPSAASLIAAHGEIAAAFAALAKSRSRLLVDLRHAPSRNDDGFEDLMKEQLPRLYKGWERLSVLVASSIGRLHVERHVRAGYFDGRAFDDPDEAEAYLG